MISNRRERIGLLKRVFGRMYKSADGVNVACYCPKCEESGKKKLKLAVRLDDGRYHCWVCGIKGASIASIISRYRPELQREAEKYFPHPKKSTRTINFTVPNQDSVALPPGFQFIATNLNPVLPEFRKVINYVVDRGLTERDMWRYRLGFSTDDMYTGRVIIPSFDASGDLNYFVSRADNDRTFPRYRNAGGKKQAIVFNELDIDWNSELVVTEGPFDVFKCPDNSTCLFGNTLSEDFLLFHRIVENCTPVVLALDKKERRNTNRIAKLLYSYDIDVRIMDMSGYKDVGEMPRDVVKQCVNDARSWSPSLSLYEKIARISPAGNLNVSGTVERFSR